MCTYFSVQEESYLNNSGNVFSNWAQAAGLPYSSTIHSEQMQNNLCFSEWYVTQIVRNFRQIGLYKNLK